MKKLLFALFMLLALPVSAQDFVGKWQAILDIPGMGEMKSSMIITKDEEGAYKLNMGESATVKSLTVKDNTMTVVVETMGMEATMFLELKEADKITGSVDAAGFGIDFEATRIKEDQQ